MVLSWIPMLVFLDAVDALEAARIATEDIDEDMYEDTDLIKPGDTVFFRAHTGMQMHVRGEDVRAQWDDYGDWQAMVIEKNPLVIENSDDRVFHSGDMIFLKAHTGKYVDVEGEGVQARWKDLGTWQGLVIIKQEAGPIRHGD